ncbi:MAG: hypothetical protein QM730_14185 [Anaerolineales bacterium]
MSSFKYFFAIFGGTLVTVVAVSWFAFPNWHATEGGFWTLLGIAAVGVAGFLKDVVGIMKDLNEMRSSVSKKSGNKANNVVGRNTVPSKKSDTSKLMHALFACTSIQNRSARADLASKTALTTLYYDDPDKAPYKNVEKLALTGFKFPGKFDILVDALGDDGYEKTEDGQFTDEYQELVKIWSLYKKSAGI